MHNSIQTKKRIIEIAIRLFEEKGFDNVSIKEICKELGYGRSAFYYHFKNKDEILMNFYQYDNVFTPKVTAWILSGETEVEKAKRVQLAHVRHITINNIDNITRLISVGLANGFSNGVADDSELKLLLKPLIQSGKKNGEIKNPLDIDTLCDTAISIQVGVLMRYIFKHGNLDFEKVLRDQLDALYIVNES